MCISLRKIVDHLSKRAKEDTFHGHIAVDETSIAGSEPKDQEVDVDCWHTK